MAAAAVALPQVHTKVRYFHNLPGTTVEPIIIGGPEKPKQTPKIDVPVAITDVTGRETDYLLALHGFEYAKHSSQLKEPAEFEDDELVKKVYYPEMTEFLRNVLDKCPGPKPSEIEILHHVIRTGGGPGEDPEKNKLRGPVFGVHIDQTAADTPSNARRWLGAAKADRLLSSKARVQVMNMWRPLFRPVERDALAVLDARYLGEDEIVEVPVVFPDHTFRQCEISYRKAADAAAAAAAAAQQQQQQQQQQEQEQEQEYKNQQYQGWHYKKGMTPEDVLVFVQDDTSKKMDGVPRRVAHVAFRDPEADEDSKEARSSIELRAMVFYDDDLEA